jgi:hypothetical protein
MTNLKQFCPRGHDTFIAGRDSSYRCLACKREQMWEASRAREAEEAAIRQAERQAWHAAEEKQRKAERARIIAAGGRPAREARWQERYSRSLQNDGPGLCQWSEETGRPGDCFLEAGEYSIYCDKHDAELEEHQAEYRRLKVTK